MIRKAKYAGLSNCYRLSNGAAEAVVTAGVGPRVLRYGFRGAENILGECPDAVVETELGAWRAYGGHRLWHAPEGMPRSYVPDNSPVRAKATGGHTVALTQPVEAPTGIQKELVVTLAARGTQVTILHRLINRGLWPVELAPWGLTIMSGGGSVILPQEPYRSHDEYLLPARPVVLWHYTDLNDPRFAIGPRYLRLSTNAALAEPQKIGVANKQGWAAYFRSGTLFVKQFPYEEGRTYPDGGCNCESYTAASFIELETLAPMRTLEPGASAEHVERWHLFKGVEIGDTEASLDAALCPLLAKLPPL